jgi:hypothetical protein
LYPFARFEVLPQDRASEKYPEKETKERFEAARRGTRWSPGGEACKKEPLETSG